MISRPDSLNRKSGKIFLVFAIIEKKFRQNYFVIQLIMSQNNINMMV